LWHPAPQVLWRVDAPVLAWALRAICLAGWVTVVLASFMVSHADLFGLRQTWMRFVNQTYTPVGFRLVGLYKLIRHPLMLGFLIAFWSTPIMTVGHLFFAVMTSLYIAMGVWFEERDLVAQHGKNYLDYRRSTRAILPIPRSGR
jgi:protein-S-isoprenylcysteine O-methyltransferase Ste14